MPTGQIIVNNALTALGILEQGGMPSVSDSNDALSELNTMWDAWSIDEGLIFAVVSGQYTLVAATGSYTIGTGATFDATRPSRIYKAVAVSTVGSAKVRRDLRIVEAGEYYAHGDLAAQGSVPEELYPDYDVDPTTGFMTLYLFPVPAVLTATKLELETAVPFAAWTLVDTYIVPPAFQDGIQYALAFRLLARYGAAVEAQVAEVVKDLGMKAEARVRAMNAKNRRLAPEMVGLQPPAPAQKAA